MLSPSLEDERKRILDVLDSPFSPPISRLPEMVRWSGGEISLLRLLERIEKGGMSDVERAKAVVDLRGCLREKRDIVESTSNIDVLMAAGRDAVAVKRVLMLLARGDGRTEENVYISLAARDVEDARRWNDFSRRLDGERMG